ncbi:hypothetical protein V8F20_003643 [Naviculisporaceae sp. PSN 640]
MSNTPKFLDSDSPSSQKPVSAPTSPTFQPTNKFLTLVPAVEFSTQTSMEPSIAPEPSRSRAITLPATLDDVSPTTKAPSKSSTSDAKPEEHKNKETAMEKMRHKARTWSQKIDRSLNPPTPRTESVWPVDLEEECEKAAKILRSFCHTYVFAERAALEARLKNAADEETPDHKPTKEESKEKAKEKKAMEKRLETLKRFVAFPPGMIAAAEGLAIFTISPTAQTRVGQIPTGSGVLVGRLPDGRWSAPSAIAVTSMVRPIAGSGSSSRIQIYDCVVVINTKEAMHDLTRPRKCITLGPG